MKAVLLNVNNNKKAEVVDIEDDLKIFYKLLDCKTIDIVFRYINGKPFRIICDDDGLLRAKPKISAIDGSCNIMLVGNLLVVNADINEGALQGLNEEEVQTVKDSIKSIIDNDTGAVYYIITNCEYGVV